MTQVRQTSQTEMNEGQRSQHGCEQIQKWNELYQTGQKPQTPQRWPLRGKYGLHFVPAGVFRERVITEQALVQIRGGKKWNDHAYSGQPQGKGDQPNRNKDSKRDQGIKQAAYDTAPVLTFQLRIVAACHQANQG